VPEPSRAIGYGAAALFTGGAWVLCAWFMDGASGGAAGDMSWPACPDMSWLDADGATAGADAGASVARAAGAAWALAGAGAKQNAAAAADATIRWRMTVPSRFDSTNDFRSGPAAPSSGA